MRTRRSGGLPHGAPFGHRLDRRDLDDGARGQLLRRLGYDPAVTVLSVPVTFASMKNKDIDVFLGNWMPSQEADREPYDRRRSVVVVRRESRGREIHPGRAGLHPGRGSQGFQRHPPLRRPSSNDTIYGIEPGNDGNRLVLDMIKQNQFGLGDFKLIESSEQGMLAAGRARRRAQGAHRVPRVGAASDEHALRHRAT